MNVLIDTSVWVDHFRSSNEALVDWGCGQKLGLLENS